MKREENGTGSIKRKRAIALTIHLAKAVPVPFFRPISLPRQPSLRPAPVSHRSGRNYDLCRPISRPRFPRRFARGGGPHDLASGAWTDDTSMALALADRITSVDCDPMEKGGHCL